MKTLVLGLGNTILTDDGVGIYVTRQVANTYPNNGVTFAEASVGGLRLLGMIAGYDHVIMVDAIQTGGQPGLVHRLHPQDLRSTMHASSSHDLSLAGALALGRELDMSLPQDEDITILAVEVEDVWTFGEGCTEHVEAAIPAAANMLQKEILSASNEAWDEDESVPFASIAQMQQAASQWNSPSESWTRTR